MDIDPHSALLTTAQSVPSENFNQRPDLDDISLLVIHNISLPQGEYGNTYITDLFCNQLDPMAHPSFEEIAELQVSAHVLVRRDGTMIQYVPFTERAWHAGVSCFEGRENCNDFSIGIELEGQDTEPYTDEQYQQLSRLTQLLLKNFPKLSIDRVVGHSDIAPDRKTDPGPAFDWTHFRELLTKDL